MTEQRLQNRWAREDKELIDGAISTLLQHHNGRKLLWWLLQIGKVGLQPMSNNALQTAFACGELNVGQQILDRITSISPDGYLEMMKEMADERTRRASALADATAPSGSESESDSTAESDA